MDEHNDRERTLQRFRGDQDSTNQNHSQQSSSFQEFQSLAYDAFCTVENFKMLDNWVSLDNYANLVFQVSENLDSFRYVLNLDVLPIEWTCHLITILKKITQVGPESESVNLIVLTAINSNFLSSQLKHFLQGLQLHGTLRANSFSIMQNMFDLIDYTLKYLPQYNQQCCSSLNMIKNIGKSFFTMRDSNTLSARFSHLLNQTEKYNPQVLQHKVHVERMKKSHDQEMPPDNFTELTIFPDIEELQASYEPFLRANKTTGAYRSLKHYTDIHFRLLREDYLSPIRNGLKEYKEAIQFGTPVKSNNLRFYYNVQLVKMTINDKNQDGINFIVKFDNSDLNEVNWEFSKRFLTGALLCFSKDNFESLIFATVTFRKTEDLENGCVKVTFQSNLEDVFTTSVHDIYVMAETVSFFESYRHVLEGLQEVDELPLSDYIISCNKYLRPPSYITERTCFDFSPIMKDNDETSVKVLSHNDWPDPEETILNESQFEALQLCLTNELVIIQGPPGTGKTFIGLKIMELILANRREIDSVEGPILVVCYSNHALDQFLEGILDFCPKGIVRVGGRSKSERLEKFNLKELTRNQRINRNTNKSISKTLDDSRRNLKIICKTIRALWHESLKLETTVLTLEDLKDEISENLMASLTDRTRTDGVRSNIMSQWMKAANADIERHIKESAKRHLTNIIVSDGIIIEDHGLLSKIGPVRPDFEKRIQIYRGWLKKYHSNLEQRFTILDRSGDAKKKDYNAIFKEKERSKKEILPDDTIIKYMSSPDVYESVKKCVNIERGEPLRNNYIKCWLLEHFSSADQMLDAISKMLCGTEKVSSRHQEGRKRTDWVIGGNEGDNADTDEDNYNGLGCHLENDDEDDDEGSSDENISDFRTLEAEFNYSERKEILLLQKAKLLGINLEEEEMEGDSQSSNTMTYSKIFKLIYTREPFSVDYVSSITNVWSLSLPERYRLYKFWMLKKKVKIARVIADLTQKYNHYLEKKVEALSKKKVAILKSSQVIGMTTTGAAKNRKVLKSVAPQIIVVEEAAEVLEAHIITTLNMDCKHLILIGDHQQLRPNPTVYQLAKDFQLEISLFERLVKNKLPMVILEEQHRMRPEISKYLRLIYHNLRDHDIVKSYDNISGITSNIFFLHHEYEEQNIIDSTSKENMHEAEFLRQLCKYFLLHEYTGHQITILAAYGGQVENLKKMMQMNDIYEYVTITSIDNYQGEENDIILLSLVRSNMQEEVGFLKINNRVCVALSRARKGLFVIGNINILASKSKLWSQITELASKNQDYGRSLRLQCVNHRNCISSVTDAEDFRLKVPEGGCDKPCNTRLKCGHICTRHCHSFDIDHKEQICRQPCLQKCAEGHQCQKLCYQECGLCETAVERIIPKCGHLDWVPCYESVETAFCHKPCGQKMACSHICKGYCGECSASGTHSPCNEKVERQWPSCLHVGSMPCHADVKHYPCPVRCPATLNCGHRCKGTCGECLAGKVHTFCGHQCEEILPCGHRCSGKCSSPCEPCPLKCPSLCLHGPCSKTTCGEPCDSCMENCPMTCKHQQCCNRCADECPKGPCKRKCSLPTKCHHSCSSFCGEECVCLKCELENFKLLDFSKMRLGKVPLASKERALKFKPDKDTVLMKIPRCGHVFTISQLDQYVNEIDPEGSQYLRCPLSSCSSTLQGIHRYNSQIKVRALRRENRKYDIRISSTNNNVSIYQNNFSSAIQKIKGMHEHFNPTVDMNVIKWERILLCLENRVTSQFIYEFTMEMHRLLIREQLIALKRMLDKADYSLTEPLKSQSKMKKALTKKMVTDVKEQAEDVLRALYEIAFSFESNPKIQEEAMELHDQTNDVKTFLMNHS